MLSSVGLGDLQGALPRALAWVVKMSGEGAPASNLDGTKR